MKEKEYKYRVKVKTNENKNTESKRSDGDYGNNVVGGGRSFTSEISIGWDDHNEIPELKVGGTELKDMLSFAREIVNRDIDIQMRTSDGEFHRANELTQTPPLNEPKRVNDEGKDWDKEKKKESNGSPATEKQLKYIDVLSNKDGDNYDTVTAYLHEVGKEIDEISKFEAIELINQLKR